MKNKNIQIVQSTEHVVTTQLTAKHLKGWTLLSSIGMLTSIATSFLNYRNEDLLTTCILVFLISAIAYIVTKIRIWWNHG